MRGIEKEAAAFFCAVLSGGVAVYSYQILNVIRSLWKHGKKLINTEDVIYWLGISGYLFYQIYKTTYGIIRWHFVLGVVAGAAFANCIIRKCRKWRKHLESGLEKPGKKVEKQKKTEYND